MYGNLSEYLDEAIERDEIVVELQNSSDGPQAAVTHFAHDDQTVVVRLGRDRDGVRAEVSLWRDGEMVDASVMEMFQRVIVSMPS